VFRGCKPAIMGRQASRQARRRKARLGKARKDKRSKTQTDRQMHSEKSVGVCPQTAKTVDWRQAVASLMQNPKSTRRDLQAFGTRFKACTKEWIPRLAMYNHARSRGVVLPQLLLSGTFETPVRLNDNERESQGDERTSSHTPLQRHQRNTNLSR